MLSSLRKTVFLLLKSGHFELTPNIWTVVYTPPPPWISVCFNICSSLQWIWGTFPPRCTLSFLLKVNVPVNVRLFRKCSGFLTFILKSNTLHINFYSNILQMCLDWFKARRSIWALWTQHDKDSRNRPQQTNMGIYRRLGSGLAASQVEAHLWCGSR